MQVCPNQRGFTLIELLVAIGIVGILAAIAIPQYQGYRAGAFDKDAELSLRTVATAEEAYFVDYGAYINCNQSTCPARLPNLDPIPSGVTLQITATPSGYVGTSTHSKGSGQVFTW